MQLAEHRLTDFATGLLVAAGVASPDAQAISESLVGANLRGHDSHGVVRIPDYVDQMQRGELVAGAPFEVLRETAAMIAADAHLGFGQLQCAKLIEQLVPKARALGIACGTLKNCGHVGRLGEWVERIAQLRMAGLITVNDNGVLKCVAPPGGIEPRISTNPVAFGIPTGGEPLVLDISTSVVANGKIRVAQLGGRSCPEGWLQDAKGNPTTDPSTRFADPPGTLLPLGGEQSGYKGFGLGLVLDMLTAGLAGGFCPPAEAEAPLTNNVLMVVWNAERFAGRDHFEREAAKLVEFARQPPFKPGVTSIQMPGDRSRATAGVRRERGIPLDDGTWGSLVVLAAKFGVTVPTV